MQIIKRMPIPFYEIECQECGSVIHFRAAESQCDKIACPVCGVTVWTMNALKLEGHADPPGEPGPCGVPCSTNGDKIRAMTDEELANLLQEYTCPEDLGGVNQCEKKPLELVNVSICSKCWLDWLGQERKEQKI